jgi:hypothetical protein
MWSPSGLILGDEQNEQNEQNGLFTSIDNEDKYNFGKLCNMSDKWRLIALFDFTVSGILLYIYSAICIYFFGLITFGISYTLGCLFTIVGILFVLGPRKLLSSTFQSLCYTIMLILSVLFSGLTLLAAIYLNDGGTTMFFVTIQIEIYVIYVIKLLRNIVKNAKNKTESVTV